MAGAPGFRPSFGLNPQTGSAADGSSKRNNLVKPLLPAFSSYPDQTMANIIPAKVSSYLTQIAILVIANSNDSFCLIIHKVIGPTPILIDPMLWRIWV